MDFGLRYDLQVKLNKKINKYTNNNNHGCQNPDLDSTILRFYDPTYPKRSKSFKDLCERSGSVGSYDSDDPK